MSDDVYESLKNEVAALKSLFDDPQPGLITWNEFVHRHWEAIVKLWERGEK